jgi:hypothetical protein
MKRLFLSSLAVLSISGCSSVPMAEPSVAAPSAVTPVTNAALAGQYAGSWTSTEGTSGGLHLKLRQDAAAAWVAEATFTYEGTQIPGKVQTIKVDGTKLRLVFDWSIQSTPGQSTITGELAGDTLKGTYETKGIAGASKGTWSMKRS